MHSSRVHFIPDRIFWAWNNVLYVDQKPVFYSPFLYRNLDKQRIVFQVSPGNDSNNGTFAKTITTLRLTDNVYDRFLYDHYSIAGNGVGNEFDYQNPGKMKGSLFGYYINPHTNPDLTGAAEAPQYTIRSYHWQQINPTTTLQSNVNLRQNVGFNDQFFQQDINQAVSDITNSVALSKTTKSFIQRIFVEGDDAPDPGDTSPFANLHTQTASLPSYTFTMTQVPLWSPGVKKSTATLTGISTSTAYGPWTPEEIAASTSAVVVAASTPTVYGPRYPTVYDPDNPRVFGPWTPEEIAASPSAGMGNSRMPWKPKKEALGALQFTMNGGLGNSYFRQDERVRQKGNWSGTLSQLYSSLLRIGTSRPV